MNAIQYDDIFLVFQGMMSMMLIFVGLQNYFTRYEAYWYYFFHIFCWILYFAIRHEIFFDWVVYVKKSYLFQGPFNNYVALVFANLGPSVTKCHIGPPPSVT